MVSDPSFLGVFSEASLRAVLGVYVLSLCGSWLHWMSHEGASWDTLGHTEKHRRSQKKKKVSQTVSKRVKLMWLWIVFLVSQMLRFNVATLSRSAQAARGRRTSETLLCMVERDSPESQPLKSKLAASPEGLDEEERLATYLSQGSAE